jgi:hypothetical protein
MNRLAGLAEQAKLLLQRLPLPRKRERVALAILTVLISIGAALALVDVPSEARIVTERLALDEPLSVTADSEAGSSAVKGRARVFVFSSSAQSESESASREFEVVIPVSGRACDALQTTTGGNCGDAKGNEALSHRLAITWTETGKFAIEANSADLVSFKRNQAMGEAATYDSWNLEMGATRTVIEFRCPQASWFQIAGQHAPQRCVPHGSALHLNLRLDDSSIAKAFLGGLQSFRFHAWGTHVDLTPERGGLWVDGSRTLLNGDSVVIDSKNPDLLDAEIDYTETDTPPRVAVKATAADTVEVAGESKLHTLFSRIESLWLLIVGAAVGMMITVAMERIPSSDQQTPTP